MRRYAAEAIGTFALVFMGCGAALIGGSRLGDAGVALAFGLALAVMTFALAPISGAHCNPAVTLAAALTGRLSPRDIAPYAAAQIGGGAVGAALAVAMAGGRPGGAPLAAQTIANGYDRLSPGFYGLTAALIAEVTLTALFTLVVLGTSARWGTAGPTHRSGLAGDRPASVAAPSAGSLALAAGLSYSLIHLVGMPVTRMGANPARAIGPALLAGGAALEQVWLFVAAPAVGAVLAALVYRGLYGADSSLVAPRRRSLSKTAGASPAADEPTA